MIVDLSDQHPHDGFRSRLEVEIAAELDRLNIHHGYEVRWTNPETGETVPYDPDFTIEPSDEAEALRLPKWVEGKPQQMIYDLYEVLGLKRKIGERFTEDIEVRGIGSTDLERMHFKELRKPKKLAEISGECVLVVGVVGATNRLSVEMRPRTIVFSRSHPFVNQHGEEKRREQEERRQRQDEERRHWERDRARRLREAEERDQARRAVDAATAPDRVRRINAASTRAITPKFASSCAACGARGDNGSAHLCTLANGNTRWFRICARCQRMAS